MLNWPSPGPCFTVAAMRAGMLANASSASACVGQVLLPRPVAAHQACTPPRHTGRRAARPNWPARPHPAASRSPCRSPPHGGPAAVWGAEALRSRMQSLHCAVQCAQVCPARMPCRRSSAEVMWCGVKRALAPVCACSTCRQTTVSPHCSTQSIDRGTIIARMHGIACARPCAPYSSVRVARRSADGAGSRASCAAAVPASEAAEVASPFLDPPAAAVVAVSSAAALRPKRSPASPAVSPATVASPCGGVVSSALFTSSRSARWRTRRRCLP